MRKLKRSQSDERGVSHSFFTLAVRTFRVPIDARDKSNYSCFLWSCIRQINLICLSYASISNKIQKVTHQKCHSTRNIWSLRNFVEQKFVSVVKNPVVTHKNKNKEQFKFHRSVCTIKLNYNISSCLTTQQTLQNSLPTYNYRQTVTSNYKKINVLPSRNFSHFQESNLYKTTHFTVS